MEQPLYKRSILECPRLPPWSPPPGPGHGSQPSSSRTSPYSGRRGWRCFLLPMFRFCHLTRGVGSPGPRPGAAGSDVRTPGALEGAQPPWVVQGAVPWDTCGTCTMCTVYYTWIPGIPGQKGVTWPGLPATCSVHRGWSVQVPSSWKMERALLLIFSDLAWPDRRARCSSPGRTPPDTRSRGKTRSRSRGSLPHVNCCHSNHK